MDSEARISAVAPRESTSSYLRELIHFTRLHEWHPGKVPLVLGFVLTTSLAAPTSDDPFRVAIAYVLSVLYLATGYMLNNLADDEQDRAVNKRMGLDAALLRWRVVPVIVSAAVCLGLGAALLPPVAAACLLGCHVLAWTYSFPPRFKEHVLLGPFVAAFAQVTAPALTLAVARGELPAISGLYLIVTFLYGLRMLMLHQVIDHDNDIRTSTRTTTTVLGLVTARSVLRAAFLGELVGAALLVPLLVKAGMPTLLLTALAWPIALAAIRWRRGQKLGLESYAYIPLADLHESLMPLLLAGAVCYRGVGFAAGAPLLLVLVAFAGRHIERLVRPLHRWEGQLHD